MKHGLANGAASPQPPQLTWCDPPAPRGIDPGEGELCLQLLAERSSDRRPCELPQLAWRAPDDYHSRRATRSAARRHQARPTLAVGLRGGAGGAPVHGGGASSPPPLRAPSAGMVAPCGRPVASQDGGHAEGHRRDGGDSCGIDTAAGEAGSEEEGGKAKACTSMKKKKGARRYTERTA